MPMPPEYQHAGAAFDRFLADAQDALGLTSRHQTYTAVQGVLLTFRRRLSVAQGLRFADALPAVLRAIFVADWPIGEPPAAFATRAEMTAEVQGLRRAHNFSPPTAIADVAHALRRHVDGRTFATVLAALPPGAAEFWHVADTD